MRNVAEALSNTCDPLHMCEATIEESNTLSNAHERNMRPDVTVYIPIFDQGHFGHPVDRHIEDTARLADEILEAVGVRKKKWE